LPLGAPIAQVGTTVAPTSGGIGKTKDGSDEPPSEEHIQRTSAIDARTTRHPGSAIDQQKRKPTEEPFDAYDLIRLPKLLGALA
jgi:hypothetical protein